MRTNGYAVTLAENAGAGNGAAHKWPGGRGTFIARTSSWGGGSAKMQIRCPGGQWVDLDAVSLSANGTKAFHAPAGEIRCVVATATQVFAYAIATAN